MDPSKLLGNRVFHEIKFPMMRNEKRKNFCDFTRLEISDWEAHILFRVAIEEEEEEERREK